MYVDSHIHFWKLSRGDYGWLKPTNPVLYQDYAPALLMPELSKHGVEALIAVQAAPTAAEAAYLLELMRLCPSGSGVSGGLDPFADGFAAELDSLRSDPGFVGVRFGGGAFRADRTAAEKHKLREALLCLQEARLTLDLLVQPHELADVAESLEEVPALRAVVNHLGAPDVTAPPSEPWLTGMARLASLPVVAVKLSGMLTLAGGIRPARLQPYVDRLLELFGSKRLLFGSDWPVALQAGGYADTITLLEAVLPSGWTPEEKNRVRADNARQLYGLQGGE